MIPVHGTLVIRFAQILLFSEPYDMVVMNMALLLVVESWYSLSLLILHASLF